LNFATIKEYIVEPDPLPWFSLGIAVVLLAFVNLLEVAYASVNRSEMRRNFDNTKPRTRRLEQLLHEGIHLFLALSLLKYLALLLIGVASGLLIFVPTTSWVQIFYGVVGWIGLALLQPFWRAMVLPRAEAIASMMAPVVQLLTNLFRPLTSAIHGLNSWINGSEGNDDGALSDEAIRLLANTGEAAEEIEENEREMIVSILEMNDTLAREVMVPRIDIVSLSVVANLHDALELVISAGHSRIPVYEENIDSIVGILYAKDLLKCFRDEQMDLPLRELLRPAYFIPASKKVNILLQELQKNRVHIAVVVDEYGGTAGVVTVEDIIEEIVGDIQDEYDIEEDSYVQAIGPDTYLLNSRLDVYSLCKLLDIEVDTDVADTLGGLLYTLMEHVPEQGEAVEHEGWRFMVLSLDGRRIEQVRAEPVYPQPDSRPDETDEPQNEREHSPVRNPFVKIQAVE